MVKKSGRIDELQILRAIAFLEIFLGHCGVNIFTGAFGVSVFVVLMGFCMAISYLPKADSIKISLTGNVKFTLSKVKKLYGLHLVMLGFAYWFAKMPTSIEALKRMILDVLLVQSLSPYSDVFFSYNGVAWYLSTYLFICLFALCIIKIFGKCKKKQTVIFMSLMIYGVMVALGYLVSRKPIAIGDVFACWFTYIFPGYRLLDFSLGVALGWMYLHRSEFNVGKYMMTLWEIMIAVLTVVAILLFHKMDGVYDGLCYNALFAPISMLLVITFACSRGMLVKIFNNPILRWIGDISGYTFLIHQIPVRWLRIYFPRTIEDPIRVICIILIGFAVAAVGAEMIRFLQKCRQKKAKA